MIGDLQYAVHIHVIPTSCHVQIISEKAKLTRKFVSVRGVKEKKEDRQQ
jgi:hypothetical protein